MPPAAAAAAAHQPPAAARTGGRALRRNFVIALTAFLTVVDLFATQAILPTLAAHYGAGPAAMGAAVNACTLGMAVSGLAVALLGPRIDRRRGILASLLLLSVPTALLAAAPDLAAFAALRVAQGVFMAAAFTLTLAHLGERCGARDAADAFAAYVTGNVASNLVGRVVSAGLADHLGLVGNFFGFALLNLAGAALVHATVARTPPATAAGGPEEPATPMAVAAWRGHLRDPRLRAAFALGFCILFAFIGTFTYVNFVLAGPLFGLAPMALGLLYVVFLPSVVTTPLAGRVVARLGMRAAVWAGLATAGAGLPLLLAPLLPAVAGGLALVAVGTFLAQATATGFVGRAAAGDRAAASGIYLACYFSGGLVGTVVLGWLFGAVGWAGCVAGIGGALAAGALCGRGLG
jgi:predicted MFS family arabinose efflux permease